MIHKIILFVISTALTILTAPLIHFHWSGNLADTLNQLIDLEQRIVTMEKQIELITGKKE